MMIGSVEDDSSDTRRSGIGRTHSYHVPARFCMDDIGKDVVLLWRYFRFIINDSILRCTQFPVPEIRDLENSGSNFVFA